MILDREMALDFLSRMYGDVPGRISLCHTTPAGGMASGHFNTANTAASWAVEQDRAKPAGIFARCTTLVEHDRMSLPVARGREVDSLALGHLWADLDYGTEGHRPAPGALPLPPTAEAAREMIADLPTPTLVVASGGGLYPYWKLDEPVLITDENRAEVKAVSERWQKIIEATAKRHGWSYGTGVGDLARVLRLPGSVNRKTVVERRCAIV